MYLNNQKMKNHLPSPIKVKMFHFMLHTVTDLQICFLTALLICLVIDAGISLVKIWSDHRHDQIFHEISHAICHVFSRVFYHETSHLIAHEISRATDHASDRVIFHVFFPDAYHAAGPVKLPGTGDGIVREIQLSVPGSERWPVAYGGLETLLQAKGEENEGATWVMQVEKPVVIVVASAVENEGVIEAESVAVRVVGNAVVNEVETGAWIFLWNVSMETCLPC